MAQHVPCCITRRAGADLSATPYRLLMQTGSTGVVLANSQSAALTNAPIGVLQNLPRSGEAASVAIEGVTKVYAATSLAAWAPITTNSVGQAITAGSGDVVIGQVLGAALPGQQVDLLISRPWRLFGAA